MQLLMTALVRCRLVGLVALTTIVAAALGTAVVGTDRKIAVALALLALFAGFVSQAPFAALLALIVVRPVVDAYVNISLGGYSLGQVWGVALIAVALVLALSRHDVRVPAGAMAFLLAYAALTLVRPDVGLAFTSVLRLLSWVLVFGAVERISRTRDGQVAVLKAMTVSAILLVSVIGLTTLQGRYGASYYNFAQTSAGYTPPHALSKLAILVLPFILAQLLARARVTLSAVLTALLCLGVVFSFVRTSILALGVVLVGYLIASRGRRTTATNIYVFAVAVALSVGAYAARTQILVRLAGVPVLGRLSATSRAVRRYGSAGAGGRLGMWRGLITRGSDGVSHVLLGRGAGSSIAINAQLIHMSVWSHNDFIEFFVTGGLALLIAYLVFLGWMMVVIARLGSGPDESGNVRRFCTLATAGVCAWVLMSTTDGIATLAEGVVMAVFMGLVVGMGSTPGSTFLDPPLSLPGSGLRIPFAVRPTLLTDHSFELGGSA